MNFSLKLNGIDTPYSLDYFPGGELHPKLLGSFAKIQSIEEVFIEGNITISEHFFEIALLKDAVSRLSNCSKTIAFHLVIPYFPYARQDRVTAPGEAYGLKVYADLINGLKFTTVTVTDPHSNVLLGVVNNLLVRSQKNVFFSYLMNQVIEREGVFVSPDMGALKKTEEILKQLPVTNQTEHPVIGIKNRDTATGRITGTAVLNGEQIVGRHVYIVDDICDGGATFKFLNEAIREYNPLSVTLFVTHGIFSKELDPLKGFDAVYSHNVWWYNITHDGKPTAQWLNPATKGKVL